MVCITVPGRLGVLYSLPMNRECYTVSNLTKRIKTLLELEFGDLWVQGEVVGLKVHSSGHYYFTLKDGEARLAAVVFRGSARFLQVLPREGQEILCHGRLDLYAPHGAYKLLVDQTEAVGGGSLAEKLEKLKQKLAEEGLFDLSRKKPLPFLPRRIGMVTSPTSAAIQDMLRTINDRFPADILVYPVRVQGDTAVSEMVRGLQVLDRIPEVEVIILGRGGGAMEDLLPFSDEALVRAVAACTTPVISAVGHEVDNPICDLAADFRAATPTAAAEAVVPVLEDLQAHLARLGRQLDLGLRPLDDATLRVADLEDRLVRAADRALARQELTLGKLELLLQRSHPRNLLEQRGARVDLLAGKLAHAMESCLENRTRRLSRAGELLAALGPREQLARGWSILRTRDGKVVKSAAALNPGDRLEVLLVDGKASTEVLEVSRD